ncbi:MAG: ASKHA domain-containing protein [Syntrophomonas sp.]
MTEQLNYPNRVHIVCSSNGELQLLMDLLDGAGIELESSCAGNGTCGKCRVRIISGECLPPGSEEVELLSSQDLNKGIRLACHCMVRGKVKLEIEMPAQDLRILEKGMLADFKIEVEVSKHLLTMVQNGQKPSLLENILQQLNIKQSVPDSLDILRLLARIKPDDTTAIVTDSELIGLEHGDTTKDCYGVAVDIGTTTVVASLHDLATGNELAVASALNPQTQYGLDVLSRIQYAGKDSKNLKKLNGLIIDCLNVLISDLCCQSGIDSQYIYKIAVAANTVMLHLLLGVSPAPIGRAPYHPVFRQGQVLAAEKLGLKASPFASLYCLPSVSGFVGADIIAGIVASQLDREKETVLFLDLGTNGEIVLGQDGKLIACSTAAGPALEGMNIACGMRAANGAVEEVWIQGKSIEWRTIDNAPPLGLCGSGLLDLVAVMLDKHIVNTSGRITERGRYLELFPESQLSGNIEEVSGKRRYLLIPSSDYCPNGIFISQADIRQVQLAKSAIVTGIKILMEQTGLDESRVSKVYVAGAFGAYLKPANLIRLGFFPDNWRDRITFVGNTSRMGAIMALLSSSSRSRMEETAQKINYIELESSPGFEKMFVDEMSFPVIE